MSIRSGVQAGGPLPLPGGSVDRSRSNGVGPSGIDEAASLHVENLPIHDGHTDIIRLSPNFQDMMGTVALEPVVLIPNFSAGQTMRFPPSEGNRVIHASQFNTYSARV